MSHALLWQSHILQTRGHTRGQSSSLQMQPAFNQSGLFDLMKLGHRRLHAGLHAGLLSEPSYSYISSEA